MISTRQRMLERRGAEGAGRLEYLQALVTEYQARGTSAVSRLQILANLGNFAYDPINHAYLRALGVIDMCLDVLDEALGPSDGDDADGAGGADAGSTDSAAAGSAGAEPSSIDSAAGAGIGAVKPTGAAAAGNGDAEAPAADFFTLKSLELAMGALANLSADPQCALDVGNADGLALICDHLVSGSRVVVTSALTALYYLYCDATHDDIATPATLAVLKRYAEQARDTQLRNIAWLLFARVATSEQLSTMKSAVVGDRRQPAASSGTASAAAAPRLAHGQSNPPGVASADAHAAR